MSRSLTHTAKGAHTQLVLAGESYNRLALCGMTYGFCCVLWMRLIIFPHIHAAECGVFNVKLPASWTEAVLRKPVCVSWTRQTELVIRGSIFNRSASACRERKSLSPLSLMH